jgi:uncharacterized RDD family membrane protein YckC
MENKDILKSVNKKKPPPTNLDEIDLDQITFKPITQGLGFHPEKKEIPIIRSKMSTPRPTQPFSTTFVSAPNVSAPKAKVAIPKIEVKVLEVAPSSFRLMAFVVDILIVLTGTAITLFILGLGSGLSIEILVSILAPKEIILFTIGVFSIYFLFYFTILDLSSTVGKSFMGLEMKTLDGKRAGIQNSFFRSFITLLSIPLLGTPAIAEVQEKLSGTKIYKK